MPPPWDEPLPSSCLRRLEKEKHRHPHGRVAAEAFVPFSSTKTAAHRDDGGAETSVNLEDDEGALLQIWKTRRAWYGAARLEICAVDRINRGGADLMVERRDPGPGVDNPYHGNIVFRADLLPREQRELGAALAVLSELVDPPA